VARPAEAGDKIETMPDTNLTRVEAESRAAHLAVQSYDIHLDLTSDGPTFDSTTTVRFTSTDPTAPCWLDLIAAEVSSVTLNGATLEVAECFDGARVALAGIGEKNEVTVVARCSYMTTGEGLHRFVDPVDKETYLYSQFEVPDSRRVFAVFEQPDLKAPFSFTVDAPEGWVVVSNTTAEVTATPAGAQRWAFEPTKPISSYITAVCAGPYHVERSEYVGAHGTVPLAVYCRQSLVEHLDADEIFDITKRGFAFFEDLFDYPYPFGTYDQLFVPEFNAGAMENAGCVTYRDEYLFRSRVTDAAYERRAETILHEMAHMWFGDLVTMKWWNDLWLNESFATWASVLAESEATRWTQAWTTFASAEKLWALRQDQLPTTHPVSAEIRDLQDVEINFDGITYAKGAAVLKQLVAWVGRDAFIAGLRHYFADHEYGNTTLADLFTKLEEQSGRDLSVWEDQWLLTAGVNTLRPVLEITDNAGREVYTYAAIHQEAPVDHPTLRSHRIAIGLYDAGPDGLKRRERIEIDVEGERTPVPALVGQGVADLLLVNDDDLTFTKIRFDASSLSTLEKHVADLHESLPRSLAWTGATDMLRDAELPARRYVTLVLSGVGRESSLSVVQTLLMQARTAVELYSDPASRDSLRERWASGLARRVRQAEPGSDHQLALVRAWSAATSAPGDLAEIAAILDGSYVMPGLTLDRDLRWHLLQRLVIKGEKGVDDIDAELDADRTAAGERQAALARAARPTREAKQDAWDAIMSPGALSNHLLEATVAGFMPAEQAGVLADFVDPYFEAVMEVWASRTFHTAEQIIDGLFPRVQVAQTTIDRALALADADDTPRAVSRMLREGAADVERALRAQQRDATG
jgi:aminopeptidase N